MKVAGGFLALACAYASAVASAAEPKHLRNAASQAYYIIANTTTFNNLDWVNVKFGGLSRSEAQYAWIGVYSPSNASTATIAPLDYPATAPWTAAAPVKFIYLTSMTNNASTTGYGDWNFELVNMYQDLVFVLFTNDIVSPKEVARSSVLTPASYPPLRGHLTRGDTGSSMRVTWNSNSPASKTTHIVKYGTKSGSYAYTAYANTSTYTKGDMCGAPANGQGWYEPKYWHSAVLTGLLPSTKYYYSYGSDADGFSAEFSFTNSESPNYATPIKFLAYADMGMAELDGSEDHWATPEAWTTTKHMIDLAATGEYSFALHVGDISYATGNLAKWFLFDERFSLLANQIPVMVGHGNHERDYPGTGTSSYYSTSVDSGGECGVATSIRYPTPNAPGNPNPLQSSWYTFSQGPVTVIMLNSELPVESSSPQYAFLEATLKSVNREQTPWLIVAFHRPMYWNVTRDPNFAQFEPLLYQYQVDLVLTGHVHNAQVYCAIYDSKCYEPQTPGGFDAPKHVVIGNAGMMLNPVYGPSPILEYEASEYGYSTIEIPSPTELTMKFFADVTNDLHYTFTINRTYPRAPVPLPLPE